MRQIVKQLPKSLTPGLICAAFGLPQIAQAQTGHKQDGHKGAYVNIGAALLTADLDLSGLDVHGNNLNLGEEDANIFMLNARLGYRFNKFIAAEVEGGFGLGGDDLQQTTNLPVDGIGTLPVDLDANIDIDTYGAAFIRGILPINDKIDLFVRGGYGTASADADATARRWSRISSDKTSRPSI